MTLRQKTYALLDEDKDLVDYVLLGLLATSILIMMLKSVPEWKAAYGVLFYQIEVSIMTLFSIEYVLRVWCSVENPKFSSNPVKGRLQYIFSFVGIIELLGVIFYWFKFWGLDHRWSKAFQALRLFKITRYFSGFRVIQDAVLSKGKEILSGLLLVFFMLCIFSIAIFFIENPAQPDKFRSIFDGMWYGLVTMTTVGYGDLYPITPLGRAVGACGAVLGIVAFAIPTGIICSAFMDLYRERREAQK